MHVCTCSETKLSEMYNRQIIDIKNHASISDRVVTRVLQVLA